MNTFQNRKWRLLSLLLILILLLGSLPLTMVIGAEKNAKSGKNITEIVNSMSTRDKITQMFMISIQNWSETGDPKDATAFQKMNDDVKQIMKDYHFGAVILFAGNVVTTEQTYNLTKDLQSAAISGGGLPLLISIDQEGGRIYRLGSGTALPGNMALGATGNTEYAKTAGKIIASELSVLGINTNMAPVVDVNHNPNNSVIGLRSYSDDPQTVGKFASAMIEGMNLYNMIACAKHFPGYGDVEASSQDGLPTVDKTKEEMKKSDLIPFAAVIENQVDMIMTAHVCYPQLDDKYPATISKKITTDLLKEEMGFKGVVVTDAMNMAAITDYYDSVEGTILAINAGADMICMPCDLSDMEDVQTLDSIIDSIEHAVEEGAIPLSRIHDAVTRILTMKEKRGILDYDENDHTLEQALATVGCDANRALEREMAAASVTVIKNNGNFLPIKLKNDSKVLMLCPFDNEKALMLMGWNRAMLANVIPEQASVDYYRYTSVDLTAELKSRIDAADIIIVISEVTSPDRMGYVHWLSAAPNNFTTYAKENGKRSVIISADKPYDVQHYPNADAILAVYGCKGTTLSASTVLEDKLTEDENAFGPNIVAGIEVAFGVYGAKGKLPLNIPYCDNGVYSETEIIYQRGYGITYDAVHFHSYDKTYQYDNNSHFYECIDPECPDKVGSRTDIDFHEYSSYLDKVCDICGYNLGGGVGSGGIFKWILIGAAIVVFGFAMYGGYKVWKRFY